MDKRAKLSIENLMHLPPLTRRKLIAFCCGWRVAEQREADVRGHWRRYYRAMHEQTAHVRYCTPVKTWNWIAKHGFTMSTDRFLEHLWRNGYEFTMQPSGNYWEVILAKGISRERVAILHQKQFLDALEGLFLVMHTALLWGTDLGFAIGSQSGEQK